VLKGLMAHHQEFQPELAFSNCEHSLGKYLLFYVFLFSEIIVVQVFPSLIG